MSMTASLGRVEGTRGQLPAACPVKPATSTATRIKASQIQLSMRAGDYADLARGRKRRKVPYSSSFSIAGDFEDEDENENEDEDESAPRYPITSDSFTSRLFSCADFAGVDHGGDVHDLLSTGSTPVRTMCRKAGHPKHRVVVAVVEDSSMDGVYE